MLRNQKYSVIGGSGGNTQPGDGRYQFKGIKNRSNYLRSLFQQRNYQVNLWKICSLISSVPGKHGYLMNGILSEERTPRF